MIGRRPSAPGPRLAAPGVAGTPRRSEIPASSWARLPARRSAASNTLWPSPAAIAFLFPRLKTVLHPHPHHRVIAVRRAQKCELEFGRSIVNHPANPKVPPIKPDPPGYQFKIGDSSRFHRSGRRPRYRHVVVSIFTGFGRPGSQRRP